MEGRLQKRYTRLVKEHMHAAQSVAAGLSALPGTGRAFASTQAAWRFYANEAVSLPKLVEPLRQAGREALAESNDDFVLLVHDWSKLDYHHHHSKKDQVRLSNSQDIGYELYTALLVDAERGVPLCPMEQELKAADGVHTTRQEEPAEPQHHLNQILPTMRAARSWGLSQPVVHVIDREADSLLHFREWSQDGREWSQDGGQSQAPQQLDEHLFLVRVDDNRRVTWGGKSWKLPQIAKIMRQEGVFRETRTVEYHGNKARQFVAETQVVLEKPGRIRTSEGRKSVPGLPLRLRLVVVQLRDEEGRVLAEWLLLTNVPASVLADRIALWYYWRWQIESYFKLLKSAGQQSEDWQQESAEAIAKRLLVAGMACVCVWLLQRQSTPVAKQCQRVLVRLSGRQMKRRRPVTAPALLAGLEKLLAVLDLLEHYTLDDLRCLIRQAIPFLADTS